MDGPEWARLSNVIHITTGNYFQCSSAISWILSLGEKFADANETFCARPPCTKWACHENKHGSYSNITMARYLQFREVLLFTENFGYSDSSYCDNRLQ